MRNIALEAVALPLSRPFTISRGTRTSITVVRVKIEENGMIGQGECTPTPRYGETVESVMAQIEQVKHQIETGITRQCLQESLPAGAARNALDCALWRLEATKKQLNLFQLTQVQQPDNVITAETISLDSIDAMSAAATNAINNGVELLKIKLDGSEIVEKVTAIRHIAPKAVLIIDANEAWADCDLPLLFKQLSELNVAMIEQPLPSGQDKALANFNHMIPVCADESCHIKEDIAVLADRYEFINIKLDKCGGLTEALSMIKTAKKHKMRLMVGCMLGSSLAMEAGLPVAAQCELVDLDGPIWLATDNAPNLEYRQGKIWI